MFYLGGMTLGYLTPPVPQPKMTAARPADAIKEKAREEAADDHAREQELARAFLTPWHLFY